MVLKPLSTGTSCWLLVSYLKSSLFLIPAYILGYLDILTTTARKLEFTKDHVFRWSFGSFFVIKFLFFSVCQESFQVRPGLETYFLAPERSAPEVGRWVSLGSDPR